MRAALKLFAVLPKADRPLAVAWWIVVVLRGLLPALFAGATGALDGAVQRGQPLGGPLAFVGAALVLPQGLPPLHTAPGADLRARPAAGPDGRPAAARARPP